MPAFTPNDAPICAVFAIKLNRDFWTEFALNNATFYQRETAAAGNALSITSLRTAVTSYRKLTDPDGNPLGMTPSMLLVPPELEITAAELMGGSLLITGENSTRTNVNVLAGRFQVVPSSYLTSATTWWLVMNPADLPCMEVAFLNGQRTPTVQQAELVTQADAIARANHERQNPTAVHPTGLRPLDELLGGGLRAGQLIVVGGRPGSGKSVLMLQMLLGSVSAAQAGLVVSLEMLAHELVERLRTRYSEQQLSALNLRYIDSTSNLGAIVALVNVTARRMKLCGVAIDYLQLLEVPGNNREGREREIAKASRQMNGLAFAIIKLIYNRKYIVRCRCC